mgnify:CR=1 FL=1
MEGGGGAVFRRLLFRRYLRRQKYIFFMTTAPDGTRYLSVSQFDRKGLVVRRVFVVADELGETPHIHGAKTVRAFLPH